jgi:hypothetical protein
MKLSTRFRYVADANIAERMLSVPNGKMSYVWSNIIQDVKIKSMR